MSGKKPDLTGEIKIEVDSIRFDAKFEGDKATVKFAKLSDATSIIKKIRLPSFTPFNSIEHIDKLMRELDVTLYMNSSFFPVLGARANPLFRYIVNKTAARFS